MKKHTALILALLIIACAMSYGENFLRFSINATLIVFDPDGVQERIIGWLRENGGFFIVRSEELLSIRFPTDKLTDFTRFVEGLSEEIRQFDQESADVREELLALSSGIKSREEILSKNLALFSRANVKDTLEIEKELVLLVREIEELKGKLKKLENDRRFVSARIGFTFMKSSVPEKKPSSFAWINTLDFYKFKDEGFPNE